MSVEQKVERAFAVAEEFSTIEAFAASSAEVNSGSHRFEGVYYGDAGYRAKQSLLRAKFSTNPLSDLATVYWPGSRHSYEDMRRTYVDNRDYGIPFLSTSDMLLARLDVGVYVSKLLSNHLSDLLVTPGSILISRSGTIGNVAVASDDFLGKYVSDDALRVIAKTPDMLGGLYTFFQSQAGQFLVTRNKSGGVVEHIYEADLNNLAVPVLPRNLRVELTRLIAETCNLRVKANCLLDEADKEVYRQNYITAERNWCNSGLETRAINSQDLLAQYEGHPRIRLDATFQSLSALTANRIVQNCRRFRKLSEVVRAIPFTGPGSVPGVSKVGRDYGVPYVTSRDLGLARIRPAAYVNSPKRKLIEDMHPPEGTTLIMCAGSLGRTFYVKHNFERWAVSLDVIRVIPDNARLAAGYVYAFLGSSLGNAQMLRHRYGSVIPRIHSRQVAETLIPIPTDNGESIGDLVDRSAKARSDARNSEDRAIQLFEIAIERGRHYTEAEWGAEY